MKIMIGLRIEFIIWDFDSKVNNIFNQVGNEKYHMPPGLQYFLRKSVNINATCGYALSSLIP